MIGAIGSRSLFQLGDHAPRVFFVLVLLTKRRRLSKVKKTTADQKRAMTKKREGWQSEEWYGKTKYRWQQPAGEDGGQSSHDTWNISQPQGNWREISAEMDAVGTTVKEKTNTWNKSCKESAKRETELHSNGRKTRREDQCFGREEETCLGSSKREGKRRTKQEG